MEFIERLIENGSLKCNLHDGQQKTLLCGLIDCQNKGFICPVCQYHSHKEHQIYSVKIVMDQIKKDWIDSQNHVQYSAYLDIYQNQLNKICQDIKDQKIKNSTKISIQRYFQKIKIKISGYQYINILKMEDQPYQQIKRQLENIFINYKLQNKQKNGKISNLQFKIQSIKTDITQKINLMKQLLKKHEQNQYLSQIFIGQSMNQKFVFSKNYKHNTIEIQQDGKKAVIKNHYDTAFCLIEPQLKTKKSIKFKFPYLTSWVSVGIAFRDIVKAANYQFSQHGHGTFQLSYDGYTWAHNSTINQQYTGWYWNQGDTITVEYNPKQSTLKFIKNDSATQKTISFEKIKGQHIHFCVSLNSNEQAIQIVD